MTRVHVMHLVDSLHAGGTERVAVNLVNSLPRERYQTHLCTTRLEGPLASLVHFDVGRICLHRKRTWDFSALQRLVAYIREHDIKILHAHASSVFMANLASRFSPYPKIVWHDHYGINSNQERSAWVYRLLMTRVQCVMAVSQKLVDWSRQRLRMPSEKVLYMPNFVCSDSPSSEPPVLPGTAGSRVVCVANIRPVKDHSNLLRAMALVVKQVPSAHLILVGAMEDQAYLAELKQLLTDLQLDAHVTFLGQRSDVGAIVRQCDVGALSSSAEGLPLSLLEYGLANLPVVSTNVGQCADVLAQGEAGLLVPRQDSAALAQALLQLLQSAEQRQNFGTKYAARVAEMYSANAVLGRITKVYESLV